MDEETEKDMKKITDMLVGSQKPEVLEGMCTNLFDCAITLKIKSGKFITIPTTRILRMEQSKMGVNPTGVGLSKLVENTKVKLYLKPMIACNCILGKW